MPAAGYSATPDSGYPLGLESVGEVRRVCVRYGTTIAPRQQSPAGPPGPRSTASCIRRASQRRGMRETREYDERGRWSMSGGG